MMTTLHEGWTPALIHLQRGGLLRGLDGDGAIALLGAEGGRPPSPIALGTLLRRWYAADGDWVEALWRRQRDGYVEVFREQPPADVATSVVHAAPRLAGLRATMTPEALVVELDGDRATVSRVVRHARVQRRERRRAVGLPEHVIGAVNVLSSRRDEPRRFVQLVAERDRRAFAATSEEAARALCQLGATRHRELGAVLGSGAWDRDPAPRRIAG